MMEIIHAAAVSIITLAVEAAGIGAHIWLTFFDELSARRERKKGAR